MKSSFKAKDKIMVHLTDYDDSKEEYSKPKEITQSGIAKRLKHNQNTISYALKTLKEEGYVQEEVSRVENKKQSMKTYYLTEDGMDEAKKVKKNMENTPIKIDIYGEKRTIKAGKVKRYISSEEDILDIIIKQQDKGIEIKVGDEEGFPIKHVSEFPEFHLDIDLDIESLEHWYNEKSKPALFRGSNTFLLSKFTKKLEEHTNIFHFKVDTHKAPIDLWNSLSNFLSKMDRRSLYNYRQYTDWMNGRTSLKKLKNDLEYVSALMIFEKIDRNHVLNEIILKIIKETNDFKHIKIILTSDKIKSIKLPESIHVLEFEEDIPIHMEDIILDKDRSLDDIIYKKLDYHLSIILDYLSIFRYPIQREELLRLEPIDKKRLENAVDSNFILKMDHERIAVMEEIRDKKIETMSEGMQRNLHFLASKYYENKTDPKIREVLERLYHLIEADKIKSAKKVLKDTGRRIISHGYCVPFLKIIEEVNKKENIFTFYKAEAKRVNRDYESSKKYYEEVLESSLEGWQLKSYLGLSKIEQKLGNFDQAIYNLNKAEELVDELKESSDQKDIRGRIYARRGEIWNKTDNYEKARKDLKKAIQTLVHEEDHHLLTSSYFILARMEKEHGKIEDAIEPFKMGLETWSKLSFQSLESRNSARELGTLYKVLSELEDADIRFRTHYQAETSGPIQEEYEDLKTAALLSLAECYMENERYEKAIEVAKNAKESMLEEDKREKAFTEALLGKAYLETNQLIKSEEHLGKAISFYQELNQPYELGLTYFSMAKVQEKKKDGDAVADYYRKAVLSFSKIGAEHEAERVKREIENIPITM